MINLHLFWISLLFIFLQICCCIDETYFPVHPPFHWHQFPKNDEGNPGHYKIFSTMYGAQEPTEEGIPSNVNNVRKVSEQEQVSSKLDSRSCKIQTRTLHRNGKSFDLANVQLKWMLLTDTQGKVKISPTSILLYINLISNNSDIILKIGSYSFVSIKIHCSTFQFCFSS